MVQLATTSFLFNGSDTNPLPEACNFAGTHFIIGLERGKVHQWLAINPYIRPQGEAGDFTGIATNLFNRLDQNIFGDNLPVLSKRDISLIGPCTKDSILSDVSQHLGNITLDSTQFENPIKGKICFYNSRTLPDESRTEIANNFWLESNCKPEFCLIPVGLSKVSSEQEKSTEA